MDKTYVPVTLIINISGDSKDALFVVDNRGDRDESLSQNVQVRPHHSAIDNWAMRLRTHHQR